MNPNQAILDLAKKYNLVEGKFADYYKSHNKWCLTKAGTEEIIKKEEIEHTTPVEIVSSVFIAFTATFKDKEGNKIFEVGSCRFNGALKRFQQTNHKSGVLENVEAPLVNNPEFSHAPEMALKRLRGRGALALVAAGSGIVDEAELSSNYHKYGSNEAPHNDNNGGGYQQQPQGGYQNQRGQQNQQQQNQQQPPRGGDQQQGGNAFQPPPEGTKGWVSTGLKLAGEWNELMGGFADVTSEDRAKWERKLYDAVCLYNHPNGNIYYPSRSYSTFGEYSLGKKDNNGVITYNAYGAMKALHRGRELLKTLETTGAVTITENNGRGGTQSVTIYSRATNPNFRNSNQNNSLTGGIGEDTPFNY